MLVNTTTWDEPLDPCLSEDLLRDFALMHARQGGALGKQLIPLIRGQRFAELCAYTIDYTVADMNPTQYANLRQALAFFTKLEDLDIGVDKKEAALVKFMEAETRCFETNEIFRAWQSGEFSFLPEVDRILSDAAQLIAKVLGPVPELSELRLRFGPGATTLTKKRDATARRKLRDGIACSEDLLPILEDVLREVAPWTLESVDHDYRLTTAYEGTPLYVCGDLSLLHQRYESSIVVEQQVQVVRVHTRVSLQVQLMDEELSFAPKNASTFRPVSKPPVLSGMVQLAVGDYMGKRLARFGVDLKDQGRNQALAKEGSLTGELATLDLTSASDMKAIGLVSHLLPVDWFTFLGQLRCSYVTYEGERRQLEKFASMGNGFTFPLETLIFWALAKASSDAGDVVSVYGDDIILPSRHAGTLKSVLDACGFVLNLAKSFSTGPFRESCGADWYRGFNIRPWYAKTTLSLSTLYQLRNSYARSGQTEFMESVEKLIPESFRLYGPDGYGDGVLVGAFNRIVKRSHRESGFSGFCFKAYKHKGLVETLESHPLDTTHALYSTYMRASMPAVSRAKLVEATSPHQYASELYHKRYLVSNCIAGEPIPFSKEPGYNDTKANSLPGTLGSDTVLIYTLG